MFLQTPTEVKNIFSSKLILDKFFIVNLRSKSRSGEGQVEVRKARVRSESCELKDLNINLRTWT